MRCYQCNRYLDPAGNSGLYVTDIPIRKVMCCPACTLQATRSGESGLASMRTYAVRVFVALEWAEEWAKLFK